MNNMIEKVIKDGSETRRVRYNMVSITDLECINCSRTLIFSHKNLLVEYGDACCTF